MTLWPLPSQGRFFFFFFFTISLNLHWLCDFLWQINVVEITGFQFQLESPKGLSYDSFLLSGAPTSVYSASWKVANYTFQRCVNSLVLADVPYMRRSPDNISKASEPDSPHCCGLKMHESSAET